MATKGTQGKASALVEGDRHGETGQPGNLPEEFHEFNRSSNLIRAVYNADQKIMDVWFVHARWPGGLGYRYFGVPQSIWTHWLAADNSQQSAGSFHRQFIAQKFKTVCLVCVACQRVLEPERMTVIMRASGKLEGIHSDCVIGGGKIWKYEIPA